MSRSITEDALDGFRRAVGTEHVSADDGVLTAVETATFATTQRVPAVVRPGAVSEVQACVRLAADLGVPLYPISRGSNWGYGSRVPVRSGSVVLDLSRMDRISSFDEALAHVDVEPGVSFRQLNQFLRARGSSLLLCTIGGSPDSSLIGNVVERGIGKGPYGDRFAHVCNMEVVTGTGALVHTGLGRFIGAKAAPLHRWGLGPSLDGLFGQSSFGVVTRLTQWLTPRPEHFQILFYQVPDERQVPAIVDALRPLMLGGVLRPTLTLYNDYRVFSATGSYPFERSGGRTPLANELRAALRREAFGGKGAGAWGGDIAVHSPTEAHARATRELIERALAGQIGRLEVIEANAIELDALLARSSEPGPAPPDDLLRHALLYNFLGVADDDAIRSVYWRKPSPPGLAARGAMPHDASLGLFAEGSVAETCSTPALDPDRDRVGLIWCSAIVPFLGGEVAAAIAIMESCMSEHGFEPGLTLQCLSERTVYVIGSISYDRNIEGDDERALACHRKMSQELMAVGYPPYRLVLDSAPDQLASGADDTRAVLDSLSRALDPAQVLAPGRYRV